MDGTREVDDLTSLCSGDCGLFLTWLYPRHTGQKKVLGGSEEGCCF